MKILVVSDNHREEKILTEIVQKMGKQVDLMIHCGDSELAPDQEPMSNFKAVKGNNDYGLSYPNELVINAGQEQLYLTHGHLQRVNFSLTPLMLTGQEKGASIVCYGHTHQLGAVYDHQMLIIIDAQPEQFIVDYYNREMEAVPELHCEFRRQK